MKRRVSVLAVAAACLALELHAQSPGQVPAIASGRVREARTSAPTISGVGAQSPFLGSRPADSVRPGPLPLTLSDAIDRALKYNLGVLTLEQHVESARGARWRSSTGLLPAVQARTGETRQTVNLAAFGFDASVFPGVPTLVGPFTVFDARVFVSQPVVDISALNDVRRTGYNLDAARLESRNAREVVVLVAVSLYLQAVAGVSRIDAVRVQVGTAEALLRLATDQKDAGAAPGIDVLRAQVQLEFQRQRLIAAENEFAKQKLQIARAVGLPAAQEIELVDRIPYAAMPALRLEEALPRAALSRADYQAVLARVQAAEADQRAVKTEALPSLHVSADYGAIGANPSSARRTYSMTGAVRMSVFEGGSRRGRLLETQAILRERQAEAQDFAQRIESEVRGALLDVQATEQQLKVAQGIVDLANQELAQAQNRFSAGVTSNLEVIQAQDAVATASENQIASLYAHNVAKATLARALGSAEETAKTILRGSR